MARRHHYNPLYLRAFLFLAALYIVISVGLLLYLSVPTTQEGLGDLQQGQSLLLRDPVRAAASFDASNKAFEQGFERLQEAPFAIKILAVLPPFRWQVRLLKATHALGVAGSQASQLVATFPTLAPQKPSDLGTLLASSSSSYLSWYATNQDQLTELQTSLDQANQQLQGIPNWILLGNSAQLRQLKDQVQSTDTGLATLRQTSEQIHLALGSADTGDHAALIALQYDSSLQPYGNQIATTLLLEGSGGSVTHLTYASSPPLAPDAQASGLFAATAPALATAYARQYGHPIEDVVLIDSSVLDKLLALSGPITLSHPGAPLADHISGKPDLLSTPYLAELLSTLVDKLSHQPEAFSDVATILSQAKEDKSLQLWSNRSELQKLMGDSDQIPAASNWLKVLASSYSPVKVTLSQQTSALHHTLSQTLKLEGQAQKATVYLPAEATAISAEGALQIQPEAADQRLTFSLPAQITYSLPYTAATLSLLHVLSQPGSQTTLQTDDYHFNGPVTHDLLLAK